MELVENFWMIVATVTSILTSTPLNEGAIDQIPLQLSPHLSPPSSSYNVPAIAHVEANPGPRFRPPGTPETSTFRCEYSAMPGWESCSTPLDRKCWLRNRSTGKRFDIWTDYETEWPVGTLREYNLDLQDSSYNADGLNFPFAKLFNGQYPGPWLEACWGDRVKVNVKNSLRENGTSVHWHGIRQLNSTHMDGVNGVTQCPIARGDSFTYEFNVTQYGSSWYHSHFSVQYADGAAGPITLHGPSSDHYDVAISPPLIITDWGHVSAFDSVITHDLGNADILLNGRGNITKFNNSIKPETTVEPPYTIEFIGPVKGERTRKYLLRIINTSYGSTFVFSIDHHMLKVVEMDFVPISPYLTKSIVVGIGQRYNVIVEANPTPVQQDGNYWIRTIFTPNFSDIFAKPGDPGYEETGILRYSRISKANPSSKAWDDMPDDADEAVTHSPHPMFGWTIGDPSNGSPTTGEDFQLNFTNSNGQFQLASWTLEGKINHPSSLQVDFNNITFLNLENKGGWINSWRVQPENFKSKDWVFLLIESIHNSGAHPIHLHGHDFAILNVSTSALDPSQPVHLKKDNPPRRDVVLLPNNGFIVIAFKTDNPGTWLVHCHIAFHASGGLGMQILEDQPAAAALWPPNSPQIKEAERVCRNWDNWCGSEPGTCFENDSGV